MVRRLKPPSIGLPLTKFGTFAFLFFNYLCLMSLITHWRAAWSDPGSIPKTKEAPGSMEPERVKFCNKCDLNWKPERAHHCKECGMCIYKMDHHCPWVNNCVGAKNLKYFLQFVLYTAVAASFLVLMMLVSFF
jgi:palmitoyltransferase